MAARRAPALLKGRLGRERLLDLLADEIAAGSAYLRDQVARSAGQETSGTTTLRAHGITAAQFSGHVCSFLMREWDDAATPGAQPPPPADGAAHGRRSRLVLEDGTVVGSISTACTEEADGFTARLSVTLPVTCPPQVVEHHLLHFAVEFRNWILREAAEQSGRSET